MSRFRVDRLRLDQMTHLTGSAGTLLATGSTVNISGTNVLLGGTNVSGTAQNLLHTASTNIRFTAPNAAIRISFSSLFFSSSQDGWNVEGAQIATTGVNAFFTTSNEISQITKSNQQFVHVSGGTWIGKSSSFAKQMMGLGFPIHAIKSSSQTVTTEATVTWDNLYQSSSEISMTSNEFVVQSGFSGEYILRAALAVSQSAGGATRLSAWVTSDTASQGSDVEIGGTRQDFTGPATDYANFTYNVLTRLKSGDTLRLRTQRVSGTGTVAILRGRISIFRVT